MEIISLKNKIEIVFALMSSKVSFFLSRKRLKSGSHGEKTTNFEIFLKKKQSEKKKHFFLVSAHKRDFFQKTRKNIFSVQQIDKNLKSEISGFDNFSENWIFPFNFFFPIPIFFTNFLALYWKQIDKKMVFINC